MTEEDFFGYVRERLDYNAETGWLTWKPCKIRSIQWNARFVGTRAGTIGKGGYRYVRLDNGIYREHRIIWLWMKGNWPEQIDHRNGVYDDNKWKNIREAKNQSEQNQNRKLCRNNKSGHTGVCWHKKRKKWRAVISIEGEHYNLGEFDDFEVACKVQEEGKLKFHSFQPVSRDERVAK